MYYCRLWLCFFLNILRVGGFLFVPIECEMHLKATTSVTNLMFAFVNRTVLLRLSYYLPPRKKYAYSNNCIALKIALNAIRTALRILLQWWVSTAYINVFFFYPFPTRKWRKKKRQYYLWNLWVSWFDVHPVVATTTVRV